jgi:hypothetical protein
MLLEYALQRDLLLARWPWYANFLAYMDQQRRELRKAGLTGKYTKTLGWSPDRKFKVRFEMPTVVQDAVCAVMDDKAWFKSSKNVTKFLRKFPDYSLELMGE